MESLLKMIDQNPHRPDELVRELNRILPDLWADKDVWNELGKELEDRLKARTSEVLSLQVLLKVLQATKPIAEFKAQVQAQSQDD